MSHHGQKEIYHVSDWSVLVMSNQGQAEKIYYEWEQSKL